MKILLAIFLGGGLGSVCRYGIGIASQRIFSGFFPWGTLFANVLSVVVLGLIVSRVLKGGINEVFSAFLIIGFCGGFSTFSTFSYETFRLMTEGRYMLAGLNVVVSVVACLFILFLLSKNWNPS